MSAKRTCNGTTKADRPCGANPLRPGTMIEGVTVTGKWCRTHDPDLPDSARIQGAQPGAGRKAKPRAVDVLRERIEAGIDEVLDPLWEALRAERAVVVGNGPQAYVEMVPDNAIRIAAVKELLDRGYGRPKQSSEVTVITQDAIDLAIAELEAELAGNDPDSGKPGVDRALQATEGTG